MKKICVFGASGRTGFTVVAMAREKGYDVVAFSRNEADRQHLPEGVAFVRGNLLDADDVGRAIAGSDAVVCAFGQREPYKDVFCAEATRVIVESMKAHGVSRLICVTGALIGEYPKNRSRFIRVMAYLFGKYRSAVAHDRSEQERFVEQSGLNWTIVKPPQLIEENEKNRFVHGEEISVDAFSRISRYHVGRFILDQLENNEYEHKRVVLRY